MRFELPESICTLGKHEFYLGYWHPTAHIDLELRVPQETARTCRSGDNWFLLSSRSAHGTCSEDLLHTGDGPISALAFRGYILGAALHSYSNSDSLLDYWSSRADDCHNGLFSAALIRHGSLALYTDYLGLSPLYYRRLNGGIAFATSATYLKASGDEADLLAWREALQCGFISSDRSLSSSVRRLPAGTALHASARSHVEQPWFDLDSMPAGDRPTDDRSTAEVEARFQEAMDRCLSLKGLDIELPLSSGHDSRRILAALLHRGVDFESITARVFQKSHRDLDATFAAAMASDLGFRHRIVEPPTLEQHQSDDRARRIMVDAETQNHTWVLRLADALSTGPKLVLDGLLGDILGNPGFRLPGLYRSPRQDIEIILDDCVTGAYDRVLSKAAWPDKQALRDDIRGYLEPYAGRANVAEFAFILLRQRRMTALWSQQLLPPGNVVVCPFADLEYVRLLLEFRPSDKHRMVFQRRCLETFWPALAKYPGNRDIPSDLAPGSPVNEQRQALASIDDLRRQLPASRLRKEMRRLLTRRAFAQVLLAGASKRMALRCEWLLVPILEFMLAHEQASNWQAQRRSTGDDIARS